jgi:hypothetical protein
VNKFVICKVCSQPFKVNNFRLNKAKFCSYHCYTHQKVVATKICKFCKKTFSKLLYPSEARKYKLIYCSNKCRVADSTPPHLLGSESSHWKGGRLTTTQGYISVKITNHPNANSDGYILEHRLVAEQTIGRFLKNTEIVHHINGIKIDNRPENLYLFFSNSAHIKSHGNQHHPKLSKLTSNLLGLYRKVSDRERKDFAIYSGNI